MTTRSRVEEILAELAASAPPPRVRPKPEGGPGQGGPGQGEGGFAPYSCQLPQDLLEGFRARCSQEEVSEWQVLEDLLRGYLAPRPGVRFAA